MNTVKNKRVRRQKRSKFLTDLYAALIYAMFYIPVVVMIAFSFNDSKRNYAWTGFTTQWYGKLFSFGNHDLWESLVYSLVIAVLATIISVIIGVLGGIGLKKFEFRGKKFIGLMLYVPIVVPEIVLAVAMHWFLTRTRAGLNLRAVGENPATADAAGINVTLYKYLSTCIGAGICGIGGLYYVLDYNQGIWATTGQIEALGWLAVALVIFTTWKPLNAIWGAYLFGMLYWLYQFLPSLLGITMASHITDLVQMLPYVVTIIVLIVVSMRKKKENQPPAHLGLAYFREER